MGQNKQLILIDGNSVVHRAFHAISNLTTSQGELVNAVYGFTMILFNVLQKFDPEYVAVAFDLHAPTFRHEEYKEYKANRPDTDEDLIPQFDRVKEVVRALNIPIYEIEGFEADDVLGTLSKQATSASGDSASVRQHLDTVIVSGDLDALQLVDEHTRVFTSKRKLTDEVIYDIEQVKKRYGFGPEYVIDYKALRGDPSDNIPGVKGVGEKTATELIKAFGPIEKLYDWLGKQAPGASSQVPGQGNFKLTERMRNLLIEGKDDAFLSKHLATIVRTVPIELDLDACRLRDYDRQEVLRLFQELEFRSLIAKLPKSDEDQQPAKPTPKAKVGEQQSLFSLPGIEVVSSEEEPKSQPHCQIECVQSLDQLEAILQDVREQKLLVLDTETSSLDAITTDLVGVSLCSDAEQAYYVPLGHEQLSGVSGQLPGIFEEAKQKRSEDVKEYSNLPLDETLDLLRPVLEDPGIKKIGHNLKFDALVLKNHGITLQNYFFDTLIAAYLLHAGLRTYGLKYLAFVELGWHMTEIEDLIGKKGKNQLSFAQVPLEQASEYSGMDVIATYKLYETFVRRMQQIKIDTSSQVPGARSMDKLFSEVEMPLVPVLMEMENTGVKVDEDFLKTMSRELNDTLKVIENDVINLAGHYFNLNSTQQLQQVLFDELGIKKTKRIKTGYSTNAASLEKIENEHPIVPLILQYRELAKLLSTYIDALPPLINPKTGRVHTSYNQTITTTGRLSSSKPNLQNIPARTELGLEIRKAFVAPQGSILLAADYSQVEFRILAHLAQDESMIEAFLSGVDFHTATAAKIFGVYPEQVTKDQRRVAKTVNFGVIYGQTKYGLSKQLKISQDDAEQFIQNFFDNYPEIAAYLEKVKLEVRTKGYVSTLLGRVRQIPEIQSASPMQQNAAERMAINMPVQGTAADIMKIAMIELARSLDETYGIPPLTPPLSGGQAIDVPLIRGIEGVVSAPPDKGDLGGLQISIPRLILQVHDEVVLEVPQKDLDSVAELVKAKMEQAYELAVPLKVDVEVGKSWGEMDAK